MQVYRCGCGVKRKGRVCEMDDAWHPTHLTPTPHMYMQNHHQAGRCEEALALLEAEQKFVVDGLSWRVHRAKLLALLGRRAEAEEGACVRLCLSVHCVGCHGAPARSAIEDEPNKHIYTHIHTHSVPRPGRGEPRELPLPRGAAGGGVGAPAHGGGQGGGGGAG